MSPAPSPASDRNRTGRQFPPLLRRGRIALRECAKFGLTGPTTALLRLLAARRTLHPGTTIIAVNFNTLPYMRAMVAGVRKFTNDEVQILIVDNASGDQSRRWAKAEPGVRLLRLPVNIHHGPAMNIGILRCRTTKFVALDIDAFPICDAWLNRLLDPISEGIAVSGAGYPPTSTSEVQPYVHACCLAMETRRFVDCKHTFAPGTTWDTAQSISQREWPNIHTLPITSSRGPGILGSVFGDVVYHNFYSARFSTTTRDRIDWIDRGQPEDAWQAALASYFPDRPDLAEDFSTETVIRKRDPHAT